jgi:hypothetical protein
MSKHIEHKISFTDDRYSLESLRKRIFIFDFMFCPHRMQRRSYLNSIIMKLRKVDGVSCIHKIIRGTPYDLLVKINGNELGDKGITYT